MITAEKKKNVFGVFAAFLAGQCFAPEDIGTATVQVVRIGDTNTSASIGVSVTSGTAQAGTDFITQTNRLTFSPGVEILTCPVTVLDNAICKGERTVKLSLQPPEGDTTYTAARGNALGLQDTADLVIQDDDSSASATTSARPLTPASGMPSPKSPRSRPCAASGRCR